MAELLRRVGLGSRDSSALVGDHDSGNIWKKSVEIYHVMPAQSIVQCKILSAYLSDDSELSTTVSRSNLG